MNNPFSFSPEKKVTNIGRIFGIPLALQDINWIPLNEIIIWILFALQSAKKRTNWVGWQHFVFGGLKMIILLGSEWCHNIAHVAASKYVGKPVDSLRIILGMPVLIYNEPEHPTVTPRQHIIRSLGGPVCNIILLCLARFFQRLSPPDTPAREVSDAAVGMNMFISFASLIPIPVFDGGPILKWFLISRGFSKARTEVIIARTNKVIGFGLVASAFVLFRRGMKFIGLILSFLSLLAFLAGYGKMK